MIIECISCGKKYWIDKKQVGLGVKVRCSKCDAIFFVDEKGVEEELIDEVAQDRRDEEGTDLEFGGRNPFAESYEGDIGESDISDIEEEKSSNFPFEKEETFDSEKIANLIREEFSSLDDSKTEEVEKEERELEESAENILVDDYYFGMKAAEETKSGEPSGISVDLVEGRSVLDDNTEPSFSDTSQVEVDTEKLLFPTLGVGEKRSVRDRSYANLRANRRSLSGRGSGFIARLSRIIMAIIFIFTLVALSASGIFLASELELIPRLEIIEAYEEKLKSLLPLSSSALFSSKDIEIIEDSGKWIASRYGMVYVVSGRVLNNMEHTISYIKLKSSFYSAGEKLYEQTLYAGNTLSKKEIKTMHPEAILEKLSRKSGDIDFGDKKEFVGLNFAIRPGESIPFYTVFHSRDRILGLKYKIQVVGYEKFGI